jgi:cytochrome c-type biogenesis protein CcmF
MQYIGEHLLPGRFGHFFSFLSLAASLVATIAYFLSVRSREAKALGWRRLARIAFFMETLSVFAVFGSMAGRLYKGTKTIVYATAIRRMDTHHRNGQATHSAPEKDRDGLWVQR